MQVKVKWFAAYREATETASERVETTAVNAVDLFQQMKLKHAGLAQYNAAMVAINDEMVSLNTSISEGDEVLFFPPVAGG
jgi:molybdopterin synthase sulfur carrier subunit